MLSAMSVRALAGILLVITYSIYSPTPPSSLIPLHSSLNFQFIPHTPLLPLFASWIPLFLFAD
eukprot:746839-Hanusia_phi.AAC.4